MRSPTACHADLRDGDDEHVALVHARQLEE